MGQGAALRAALSVPGTTGCSCWCLCRNLPEGESTGLHAPTASGAPYSTPIILCSLSASLTKGSKGERAVATLLITRAENSACNLLDAQ